MAIFKDAGENSEIFHQHDEILDRKALDAYEIEFGRERTLGYMEAMRDFNREIKFILGAGYTHSGVPKAGMKMRNKVAALFHSNDELLDYFVSKIKSKENPML